MPDHPRAYLHCRLLREIAAHGGETVLVGEAVEALAGAIGDVVATLPEEAMPEIGRFVADRMLVARKLRRDLDARTLPHGATLQ